MNVFFHSKTGPWEIRLKKNEFEQSSKDADIEFPRLYPVALIMVFNSYIHIDSCSNKHFQADAKKLLPNNCLTIGVLITFFKSVILTGDVPLTGEYQTALEECAKSIESNSLRTNILIISHYKLFDCSNERIHYISLVADFATLYDEGLPDADLVIEVVSDIESDPPIEFRVHKAIMCVRSVVFKQMFLGSNGSSVEALSNKVGFSINTVLIK